MPGYSHETGSFQGKGGVKLFTRKWIADRPKAVLIISHGIGEHSARYGRLVQSLENRSVSIYAYDHRGHGDSEGKRGYVESFLDYVHDLKLFINSVKLSNPGLPVFLLGHSLGGAIALRYAMTYQNDLAGLILSAPAVRPILNHSAFTMEMLKAASHLAGGLTVKTHIDPAMLSHNEDEVEKYVKDEKVHDKISLNLVIELLRNAQFCLDRAEEIRLPLLILHGSDDRICDVKGSEFIFERAISSDKRIVIYEGLYHEIMNEVEKERMKVLNDVKNWIRGKVSGGQPAAKSAAVESSEAKKTVKKAAPKKAAKKAVKKPAAKKAVKKAVKKAAPKKAAKKAVKKAAKKPVKKGGK